MDTPGMEERPRAGDWTLVSAVALFVAAGLNLLLREWLSATLFLALGLFFLGHRRVERWPKAARIAVIIGLVALSVTMLVRTVLRVRGRV